MLNFRRANLIFPALLAVLLALDLSVRVPWYFYLLLGLAYSLLLFYGVYFIRSQFFMPAVCRGVPDRKSVALTFDDGPHPEFTPLVLDILKEYDLKAAFFCTGKNIAKNRALLTRMTAEGHLVGNHSYSHDTLFDLFSVPRMVDEIRQTDRLIETVTGRRPRFFRPPYGVINPNLRDAVRASGHTVIGWNLRSYDTVINDKDKLMARLTRGIKPGAVVLLHEHGKKTIEILPDFIRELRARGYTVEPLDQLINHEAYV